MAVIQYTALVNQMRGKVNGSVLNKSRTVNTVQKKQQQPKGSRGFQSEIRQVFSSGQREWKGLTPLQQSSWQQASNFNPSRDRFGNQVILSGYNQFIKASVLASYGNSPRPLNAFPGSAPDNIFEIHSLLDAGFSVSSTGGVLFTAYIDDFDQNQDSDYCYILDISLPISGGVTSYHGRWVNVTGANLNFVITRDLSQDLGVYYPMPSPGQRILYRVREVYLKTGTVVREFINPLEDWAIFPSVTSFTITPNTGTQPYMLRASFSNKEFFDGVRFRLQASTSSLVGSCPLPAVAVNNLTAISDSLLLSGQWPYTTTEPVGSCRVFTLRVVRVSDGKVVQILGSYISRL